MTIAAILFDFTLAILLLRLSKMRIWLDLPVFMLYLISLLVTDLLPNPSDLHLWNLLWYAEVIVVMLLRAAAMTEVFWLAIMEFLKRERLFLIGALSAGLVACLLVAVRVDLRFEPIHNFTILRQCVLLGMSLWMIVGGLYIGARDITLNRNTKWHFVILTASILSKTTLTVLDAPAGVLPILKDGDAVTIADKLTQSGCFLAWMLALRTPERHWWARLKTVPHQDALR